MATESQLIAMLRGLISDDDPQKNVLNLKKLQYTDQQLSLFLKMALADINAWPPRGTLKLEEAPDMILVLGAAVFLSISEGILQLRNNVAFNDAGLTVDMFNKSGGYQSYAGFLLQQYVQQRNLFKMGELANRADFFIGIASTFNPWWNGGRW